MLKVLTVTNVVLAIVLVVMNFKSGEWMGWASSAMGWSLVALREEW